MNETAGVLDDIEPADLGLTGFTEFRQIQKEGIEQAVYSDERFQGLCMPTGSGKSGVALAIPRLTGWRTLIYTATLGLEEVYVNTPRSEDYSIASVHGRSNYACTEFARTRPELQVQCDDGARMGCSLTKGEGCEYEECRNAARRGRVVLTNYAYGITVHARGQGLTVSSKQGEPNPFDCLILDEAHLAEAQVRKFLSVSLREKEIRDLMHVEPVYGEDLASWRRWAGLNLSPVQEEFELRKAELNVHSRKAVKRDVELVKRLENLVEKLGRLASAADGEWVCEYREGDARFGRTWEFNITAPGRYTERYLFMGIPKVILLSATLRIKTMRRLGIGQKVSQFKEWPRVFPASRCPVYFIPPKGADGKGISITRKSSEVSKRRWIDHMDDLMELRLPDRRILMITTSYEYQRLLMDGSRYKQYMIGNTNDPDSPGAMKKFEEFIEREPPVILVSPSFGTGWDFKYERGEFLILTKVPLKPPASASKLIAAMLEADPEWSEYETTQDTVQICGRLQREEDDQGEVVIADGSWAWFGFKAARYAPMGFVNGIKRPDKLPPPPVALRVVRMQNEGKRRAV